MTRYAIVTGGGSGIGRASALALAAAGWHVAVAGRRGDALAAVCSDAAHIGAPGALLPVVADVSDEVSVAGLFATVAETFGRIDLLFNNAGAMMPPRPVAEVPLADWDRLISVNITGAFLCAREAFRHMASQSPHGGRIINNGSISAHVPRPHMVAYTVSKHAMTGLTRSLSLEGRGHNIACGQIDIGNAATEMTGAIAQGALQADGSLAAEPTMDVAHVATSVVHMAGLPLDANVQFMTVMATTMPFVGRG